MAILEKYRDSDDINPVPVVSQQKYNEYLKVIGKRAKLNKKTTQIHYKGRQRIETTNPKWQLLTAHVGRKTFIAMAVFLGIPMETVSRITGLKIDSIRVFYDVPDTVKQIEMQKFNNLNISE
jgi:hypothetical protein